MFHPRSGEPGRWNLARILFIAGVAVGVIAVVSWFAFDGSPSPKAGDHPGTCQVPSGGRSGTEAPPGLMATLLPPFGTADVTFTKSENGDTVYGYCFNVVAGQQVSDAIDLLAGHGYTRNAGEDSTHQLNFTADDGHPYGVSLTVTGDLTVTHPASTALGGVSIVWQDARSD